MMSSKLKRYLLVHESDYIDILKKRLASKNFRAHATPEEIQKTEEKLKKARFKYNMLRK